MLHNRKSDCLTRYLAPPAKHTATHSLAVLDARHARKSHLCLVYAHLRFPQIYHLRTGNLPLSRPVNRLSWTALA
jgi:hypothetical protein